MGTALRLEPEGAALSVARRLETIEQCAAYIRATVERYDGLKSFEGELAKLGISERVAQLMAQAPTQGTD